MGVRSRGAEEDIGGERGFGILPFNDCGVGDGVSVYPQPAPTHMPIRAYTTYSTTVQMLWALCTSLAAVPGVTIALWRKADVGSERAA